MLIIFFRDRGVSPVLKSSCILRTFRFSARWLLGLCFRPSGQPSAVSASLRLLALIGMDGFYAGFTSLHGCNLLEHQQKALLGDAGAIAEEQKPVTKKSGLIEVPFNLDQKQIDDYDFLPKQPQLELSNV